MAAENVPQKLPMTILSMYKDEFIYVESSDLFFDSEDNTLTGNIIFKATPYLKTNRDNIFNNTEATFAGNQIGLLLISCYEMQELKTENSNAYKKFLNIFANRIIVRNQLIEFYHPLRTAANDCNFIAKITNAKKTKKGTFLKMDIVIGRNKNFEIKSFAFIADQDFHNL
jgi:hypothetical protein